MVECTVWLPLGFPKYCYNRIKEVLEHLKKVTINN